MLKEVGFVTHEKKNNSHATATASLTGAGIPLRISGETWHPAAPSSAAPSAAAASVACAAAGTSLAPLPGSATAATCSPPAAAPATHTRPAASTARAAGASTPGRGRSSARVSVPAAASTDSTRATPASPSTMTMMEEGKDGGVDATAMTAGGGRQAGGQEQAFGVGLTAAFSIVVVAPATSRRRRPRQRARAGGRGHRLLRPPRRHRGRHLGPRVGPGGGVGGGGGGGRVRCERGAARGVTVHTPQPHRAVTSAGCHQAVAARTNAAPGGGRRERGVADAHRADGGGGQSAWGGSRGNVGRNVGHPHLAISVRRHDGGGAGGRGRHGRHNGAEVGKHEVQAGRWRRRRSVGASGRGGRHRTNRGRRGRRGRPRQHAPEFVGGQHDGWVGRERDGRHLFGGGPGGVGGGKRGVLGV